MTIACRATLLLVTAWMMSSVAGCGDGSQVGTGRDSIDGTDEVLAAAEAAKVKHVVRKALSSKGGMCRHSTRRFLAEQFGYSGSAGRHSCLRHSSEPRDRILDVNVSSLGTGLRRVEASVRSRRVHSAVLVLVLRDDEWLINSIELR